MFGYANKIVKINLTDRTIVDYPVSDKMKKLFVGGKILAAKILYDNLKTKIDAFDSQNMLVITTSPLTGSGAPSASRFNVSTVSPLTGIIASSNCGGSFGMHLKRAGYDGLIIVGKSDERIYLEINDDKIEFKNADSVWGKTTGETQSLIGNKVGGKFVIGPAGENLVKFAAVISEERAAGRAGVGAVFGSKNLKGIVASGTHQVEYYKKAKFQKNNKSWVAALKRHPLTGEQLPTFGTAGLVSPMHFRHLLATKNYQAGRYENFEDINGETLKEKFLVKNKGCISCPIQCARVVKVDGKICKGPEVETITLFGSNLLNNDMEIILKINHLCDELGMDTITLGSTFGFAMELNEKGLYDSGLQFGKNDNLVQMVEDVAFRRGVGNELAEGTRIMSKKFGGVDFAINVKGLELAAYEPRAAQGMGLGYAVANRGGCHLNAGYMVLLEGLGLGINQKSTKGKPALTIFFQDIMEAVSAGGNCLFTSYAMLPSFLINKPNGRITRLINKLMPHFGGIVGFASKHPAILSINLGSMFPQPIAVSLLTGMKYNLGRYKRLGERGYNLERLLNIRFGLTSEDDKLPKRLMKELQDPNNPDSVVKLDEMKLKYYKVRGWDKFGVPKAKLIKKLKLNEEG